jgi:diguanylate cyclase (GGDEF)-like protein/PAS domain S-box-containing protein
LFIAVAMIATLFAIVYRDQLTTRSIIMDPSGAGKLFDAYAFDDIGSGGNSVARVDSGLTWHCTLGNKFQWPFCGFGLVLDTRHTGKGIDLSRYQSMSVTLDHKGPGRFIRMVLKDHDPRFRNSDGSISDKPEQVDIPISEGRTNVDLKLSDLGVSDWWRDQHGSTPEHTATQFENVSAVEFVFGSDNAFGVHRLHVSEIRFHRQLISPAAFFALIGLCWVALIGGMLLVRRRQIARLKRSAENALRESERLYRNILETSTDCIILFDSEGRFEFVNSAGLKALELPPIEETRGKHWKNFWSGTSGEIIGDALRRAGNGETVRLQGAGPTAKGTQRWWHAVTLPMADDNGTITGVLSVSRDVTHERERSEELKWASEHDALTHLPNRRSFQARLQAATIRAMQAEDQVGLLLIDLDHFKHVNDSLGHSAGDDLLTVVGERLRHCVREGDFVARIGGDEFAILLERGASEEALLTVGAHVQERLRAPVRAAGRSVRARASIGGALFPTNAATADDLFKYADTALYELKQNGRGGTRLFDDYMLAQAEKTVSQLNLARGALTEKTVVPLYQPKIDIGTGSTVGLEALLRWRHPRRGLQLPATLEEAFNDYELAAKIGDLMQQKVARDIRRWLNDGVAFGRVSINAAPAEFLRDDYAERLLAILNASDVPANRVEIEVTEHAFLGRGPEYVARALNVLKQAGATVSLDDFGTGCSSLAHLRDFPVDVVKVDKSFVQQMTDDPEIAAIVAAVIDLANSLQISVVAEGVETPAQLELLRVMGCRIAQGHLYGAAVSAEQITLQLPLVKAAA